MIDPGFYEHREEDPARRVIGAFVLAITVFVGAMYLASFTTSTMLGCPHWLAGSRQVGPVCFTTPFAAPIALTEYRVFASSSVRRNIARMAPAQRTRFNNAINVALLTMTAGVIAGIAIAVIFLVSAARRAKKKRPRHKGTRFWATDEEVFATGLAVNYRPPLPQRFHKWLDGK